MLATTLYMQAMQVLHKFEDAVRHHPQQFSGDSAQRMHYAAAYLMRVSSTHTHYTHMLSVTVHLKYLYTQVHTDT
jgi:hypothetical protein